MAEFGEILEAIVSGDLDNDLEALSDQIAHRKRILSTRIKVGDTVRFSSRINPKYLTGLSVTVEKINRTTITVACPNDSAYGRFSGSQRVRCSRDLLEV